MHGTYDHGIIRIRVFRSFRFLMENTPYIIICMNGQLSSAKLPTQRWAHCSQRRTQLAPPRKEGGRKVGAALRREKQQLWRKKDPVLLQTMELKKQQAHTLWSYPRYLRTHQCFCITVDIRLNFCYFPTRHY